VEKCTPGVHFFVFQMCINFMSCSDFLYDEEFLRNVNLNLVFM